MNEFGNSAVHINLHKILQQDEYNKYHRPVARALEAMNYRCRHVSMIKDPAVVKHILILMIKSAKMDFLHLPKTVKTHAQNAMVANIRNYLNAYLRKKG